MNATAAVAIVLQGIGASVVLMLFGAFVGGCFRVLALRRRRRWEQCEPVIGGHYHFHDGPITIVSAESPEAAIERITGSRRVVSSARVWE